MFITMVSDKHTLRAATGEMYEQRFNVAASRAKDQMYLFRSFERGDLSDVDLRARLLDHFKRPLQQDSIQVKALRELCESDFECSVFDALTEKDYRVLPQVRVAGHRIDMVVEGNDSRRLAIECDGDRFHTPENWLADIARQRVLERAGWIFWRCWGSSFTRDRDGCLRDLYAALHERGIEPIGAAEIDLTGITEYREVGVSEVEPKLEQEEEVLLQPVPQTTPVSSEHTRSEEMHVASQSAQSGDVTEGPLTVGVGDSVEFIFVDDPADENWATIIAGESNPKFGLINVHTPVAQSVARICSWR
jgi:very-short-patch-repair endonuclease